MSQRVPAMVLVFGLGACGVRVFAAVPNGEAGRGHSPEARPEPLAGLEADATLVLPIRPRRQAPDSPPEGWCGETAIQEALLHAGMWSSQRLINRAGKPRHPDLYSSDIPVALARLGIRFTPYSPRKGGFARWIKEALEAGDPVLAGVKILPTQHPQWGLDHFVLVVGYGPRGLLVNTTWGHRAWVGDTTAEGLSFRNVTYGIRLHGFASSPNRLPASLSIVEEGARTVKLRVVCEGLASGAFYRIAGTRSASDRAAIAVGGRLEQELAVEADGISRFFCIRVQGAAETRTGDAHG